MDRGILTDGADYIFLDGRPTPFGMKQKRKLLLQREYAVSFIDTVININNNYTKFQIIFRKKLLNLVKV